MDRNLGSGANTKPLQKLSQPAVALVNALHRITAARLRFGKQQQATFTLGAWRLRSRRIAMRTRPPAPQFAREQGFEVAGDGMFQALRFVMHFVPLHAEDLVQHAFDQVMPYGQSPGDLPSLCRELHSPVA